MRKYSSCNKYGLYLLSWFVLTLLVPIKVQANQEANQNFVIEHVGDAHVWHFATISGYHVSIPLPIILYTPDRGIECFSSARLYGEEHEMVHYRGYVVIHEKICCLDPERVVYDFSITKNVAAMFLSVLLLVFGLLLVAKRYRAHPLIAPKGFCSLIDLIIVFIKNEIAIPNIGKKHYEQFLPYLLSIFFFICLNNLLGLLPGGANVTGSISVTLVLSAFTILITLYHGNKHYWAHIFKPQGVPIWLLPIMIPVELLGVLTRLFSLMVRLFANITAGHIILLSIIGLVFVTKNILIGLVVSLPFGTFMFLLKLLVAVLQAYVFTLLSAIYFGQAVDEG